MTIEGKIEKASYTVDPERKLRSVLEKGWYCNEAHLGGGSIDDADKTPEMLERIKKYRPETKAPPDYHPLVEYFPNAYGPAEDEKPTTKQKASEKAKA